MKGYSHALSASASWIALTSTSTTAIGAYTQTPEVVLAGVILCGGAGMWPDIDHPSSTIAWSLPPFTRWLTKGVGQISGGHRHGTHSLIGVALTAVFGYIVSLIVLDIEGRQVAVGGGVLAVLLTAFAVKVFGIGKQVASSKSLAGAIFRSAIGPWVIALSTAGVATWYLDYRWTWLVWALTLGAFVHNLGDSLTTQKVPWLWPWNPAPPQWLKNVPVVGSLVKWVWADNGYFGIPLLGSVGSLRERALAGLFVLYIIYGVTYEITNFTGTPVLP